MRTGIYGGTFSPPHVGHMSAARAFAEQMQLDELLIIPALLPPHKTIDYEDHPEKRFRMCELAFDDIDCAKVSDIELRREGKSYTVDTLKALTREGRELLFLCGTDMIMTLDSWRAPDEIFALCTPVYIRRETDADLDSAIERKIAEYKVKYGKDVPNISVSPIELSSSKVRDMVKNGEDISSVVAPAVAEYILSEGMYR